MKLSLSNLSAFVAALVLCPAIVRAQNIPSLPCCIDFNDASTPGYTISGSFVEDLEIRYPGFSGAAADGYLHAKDDSGGSWARLRPQNDGNPNCFGDWKSLIQPGRCVELCWDVNLVTDGDNSQTIAKPAAIHIWFGGVRAVFVTNDTIDEDGGWYSFCAPIALANADGTLPSNDTGYWVMNDANGNPLGPQAWNDLLCNIDQIAFTVDYHSYQTERWCWDNICLKDGPCDDCMEISNEKWDCIVDAVGNRTLTYTFDVTNNSGQIAQVGLIPTPVGFSIDPHTWDFVPDLNPGDTGTVTLAIDGAAAGTEICFDFVLFNYVEGECCREEICVKVPCVKIDNESVVCLSTVGAAYSFDVTNISGGPLEWVSFVSDQPGVTFTPSMVNLGGLADGATMSVGPVTINGAVSGKELCFYAVFLDAQLQNCCIQKVCVTMPQGCTFTSTEPGENGKQVAPCDPADAMASMSPDGCFMVCDESIECDPLNPGCVIYSFTVTNLGSSVMSHILLPHLDITPGMVAFADPLDPGEAGRVTVKIANQPAGPFTVPMILVGVKDCTCCHFMHEVIIPMCDCMRVVEEKLECEGIDPANPGFYCYTYCATITNLTGDPIEHIFLFPQSGSGVTFAPDHFATGTLPHLSSYSIVTTVKIPVGAVDVHFHISLHNADFVECCAVERWMRVPECCDCEETVRFEGGHGDLPPSVSLLNLERDPVTGKIGFSADGSVDPFPYVYMAESNLGKLVRIDANTGVVLGEYRTAPATNAYGQPSRTTVDKFGECWVGNRHNANSPPAKGGVTRIGLIIGGTRGNRTGPLGGPYTFAANPSGQYLQGPFTYVSPSVIDRDGDGLIRTSPGLGTVLDWDNALSGLNDSGGISLADDECIVNYVRVFDQTPRALSLDTNNNLWVGGTASSIYERINGSTGLITGSQTIAGGYGCLIDGNDVLWSVNPGVGVVRHNLLTNTSLPISVPNAYGIGINPCDGSIWVGGAPNLYRLDPSGPVTGSWPIAPGGGFVQGISVDRNEHVWLSGMNLYRFDSTTTTWLPPVPVHSTGNAIDHNGKVWISNIGNDSADRVDPVLSIVDNVTNLSPGAGPYNYSDMTGYVTLGAAGQTGFLLFTHDSLCPATDWGRVTWASVGEQGKKCRISVEVRASDDPLNYPATWKKVANGGSFCQNPTGTAGVVGQYIQVRFTFTRPGGCPPTCNPQLCWLKVECCDVFGVGPADLEPVVEIGTAVAVGTGQQPVDQVSAHLLDLNGDRMTATWTVNGQPVATQIVDGDGYATLDYVYPEGISQIELEVSDGTNVVTASTTVMVGDHIAPVIVCNSPEFTGGDRRLAAFEAPAPNVAALSTVTDNVTPSAQMQIIQNPPAGTILQGGTHEILLTATDAAGNVGHCSVYLIVEQVVNVTGLSNYQNFAVGSTIALGGSYQVPLNQVAQTTIVINGVIFRTINGPITQPIDFSPPAGEYQIVYVVTSTSGVISSTRERVIRVGTPNEPLGTPEIGLNIAWTGPTNLVASFVAPNQVACQLQHSNSMEELSWVTILSVEGEGDLVEYGIDLTVSEAKMFYRVLYEKP